MCRMQDIHLHFDISLWFASKRCKIYFRQDCDVKVSFFVDWNICCCCCLCRTNFGHNEFWKSSNQMLIRSLNQLNESKDICRSGEHSASIGQIESNRNQNRSVILFQFKAFECIYAAQLKHMHSTFVVLYNKFKNIIRILKRNAMKSYLIEWWKI